MPTGRAPVPVVDPRRAHLALVTEQLLTVPRDPEIDQRLSAAIMRNALMNALTYAIDALLKIRVNGYEEEFYAGIGRARIIYTNKGTISRIEVAFTRASTVYTSVAQRVLLNFDEFGRLDYEETETEAGMKVILYYAGEPT